MSERASLRISKMKRAAGRAIVAIVVMQRRLVWAGLGTSAIEKALMFASILASSSWNTCERVGP